MSKNSNSGGSGSSKPITTRPIVTSESRAFSKTDNTPKPKNK